MIQFLILAALIVCLFGFCKATWQGIQHEYECKQRQVVPLRHYGRRAQLMGWLFVLFFFILLQACAQPERHTPSYTVTQVSQDNCVLIADKGCHLYRCIDKGNFVYWSICNDNVALTR